MDQKIFSDDSLSLADIEAMWNKIHNASNSELEKMDRQNKNNILLNKTEKTKPEINKTQ
jgi:hypothetical protein